LSLFSRYFVCNLSHFHISTFPHCFSGPQIPLISADFSFFTLAFGFDNAQPPHFSLFTFSFCLLPFLFIGPFANWQIEFHLLIMSFWVVVTDISLVMALTK